MKAKSIILTAILGWLFVSLASADSLCLLGVGGGGSSIITSGLIAYYKFDEASGTIATDSSGNNFNGTYSGTTTTTDVPSAIKFADPASRNYNGTSDYMSVPSNSTLQTGGKSFTITLWFKTTAVIGQLAGKSTFSGDGEWVLQFGSGTAHFATIGSGGIFQQVIWGSASNDGSWHFCCITQDTGVNNRIGISIDNGAFVYTTIAHTSISTTDPLVFAASSSATPDHFMACKIDDARQYNRVLSATEITTIFGGAG